MKTKNEVLVEVTEDVRLPAMWLFNVVPGVGNILFTNRRCFTGLMFFWLLIVIVVAPGFLKYLGLYFTLSLAGWNDVLEERTEKAIRGSGDERFTQASSRKMVQTAKSNRNTKKEDFATDNFQKKLKAIDFKPEPKPERVYSVPEKYILPDQWPAQGEVSQQQSNDSGPPPVLNRPAVAQEAPATYVSPGAAYVFSQPDYGLPSVVASTATTSTATENAAPSAVAACKNCGTPRDHGFSFCPSCARMFDM